MFSKLHLILVHLNAVMVKTDFSLFAKTNIITNNDRCGIFKGLKTFGSSDLLDCMMICSNDDECRRMMYCSSDKPSCTTFTDGTNCVTQHGSQDCTCFKKRMDCDNKRCNCSLGYYGDKCQLIYRDCTDFTKTSTTINQVLITIQPPTSPQPFEVFCHPVNGGWATILYRHILCLNENFNRSASEYEDGFGRVPKNMWLGFKKILQILAIPGSFLLNVLLVTEDDYSICHSVYNKFSMGTKSDGYKLDVKYYYVYSKCGDSIMGPSMNLRGRKFSTYDQDYTGVNECAKRLGGGWWFADDVNCSRSFLTGTMEIDDTDTRSYWMDDMGKRPFRSIQLRIRRV